MALKAQTHTQHSLCYLTEFNTHAVYCIFISPLHVTALKKARVKLKQAINHSVIGDIQHACQSLGS